MRQLFQLWSGDNPQNVPLDFLDNVEKLIADRKEQLKSANMGSSGENQDQSYRSSKVMWLSDAFWIRDFFFNNYIQPANKAAFGIDVHNMADIQYTEYHASEGGKYHTHIDTFWESQSHFDRKLSLTVQLSDPSDYEGGDFYFDGYENPQNGKSKGSVLIFPSYLPHGVTPLTKGSRRSLVMWFDGPRWR